MIGQERETLNELLLYHSHTIGAARLTLLALTALTQAFREIKPSQADLMVLFEEVREAIRDSRPKPIPLIRLLRQFEREFLPFTETVGFEEQRAIAIRILEEKKALYESKRDLVTQQGLEHLEDGDSIIVHSASSVVTNILTEAARPLRQLSGHQYPHRGREEPGPELHGLRAPARPSKDPAGGRGPGKSWNPQFDRPRT